MTLASSPDGPIGVFDSGIGGLTVVAEIRRRMPDWEILYFGDTARLPYGNKSPDTVTRYSLEIARFLESKGIGFLVVACNTSSALALGALVDTGRVPVLGMIGPGAEAAVAATRNGKVGLIGTRGTVASGAYARAVRALDPAVEVVSQACPLFVPLVEEGWSEDPVALQVARRYLEPVLARGVDTIILGCTHYPVLAPTLRAVVGPDVRLISSAESAADALAGMLGAPGFRSGAPLTTFYVTDAGTQFREIGERILGQPIEELVAVEEERLVLE